MEEISNAARALAGKRRIVEGVCTVCGTSFQGIRTRKFCSHKCAQRDYVINKQAREKSETEGETEL